MSAMSNRYTSVIDSETYSFVPDDEIITIDAHMGVPIPHGQYNHPDITTEEMDILVDQLHSVGSTEMAKRLEIERDYLEANESHVFKFVAMDLAEIVTSLAIAKTKLAYSGEMDESMAITKFGRLVTQSTENLVAESLRYKEIVNMKPISGDQSFVDPFRVIASAQQLAFVDAHGDRLAKEDIVASEHVDDVL